MRAAVICIGMMLAVVGFWPMLFGQGAAVATASATTMLVPAVRYGSSPRDAPSCHVRYRRVAAACSGESACRLRAADDWDLCEANGRWPG